MTSIDQRQRGLIMEKERNFDTTVQGEKQVLNLLLQLLECTGQLAHCENDQGMQIVPMARACRRRLLALQQIMRSQEDHGGTTQTFEQGLAHNLTQLTDLKEVLQSLVRQTEECIAALGCQLEYTARELASLRNRRTAIHAYHGPNHRRQLS
jgi:hypothetical protein